MLVKALGRTCGDVENAGNDSDDSSGDVVGNDATRVERVEPFRTPRRLNSLKVTRYSVRV